MFGSKEKGKGTKTVSTTSTTTSSGLNTLVDGTIIEGQVNAKSDIRVDGVIKGSLNCEAKVIIGETGFIEGQINCFNAVIQGRFEGTLNVKELLNVRKTATINGEITTNKLIVEAGAIFNVSCKMGKQQAHAISIERGNKNKPKPKQQRKLRKEAS